MVSAWMVRAGLVILGDQAKHDAPFDFCPPLFSMSITNTQLKYSQASEVLSVGFSVDSIIRIAVYMTVSATI